MLLPWIVLILSFANGSGFTNSISATWWQWEYNQTPFMIILGSAALLLFSYKGYELVDDIVCSIAGAFALGICLFPCGANYGGPVGLFSCFGMTATTTSTIHNICAFAFFGLLSFNSLFLFTKSGGEMTARKKKRNIIFRVCGVGMIASFLMLLLPIPNVIWIVETVALAFFGISWLTKANYYSWLFADKK
jgi:hypothetical protein